MEAVTLRDIAAAAGVSVDTVSRVLNGKAKATWPSAKRRFDAIQQIADSMNYRPNAAARAIRNSKTRVIGALVRNNPRNRFVHPLAFETLLGINDGLEAAGYVLSIIRYDDVEFDTPTGSRVFRERMLDGMIALESIPHHVVQRLEELVPVCVWANTNVWRNHSCIHRDEVAVGRLAASRLAALGYRQFALVGGKAASVPHYSHSDRLWGVREAVEEVGGVLHHVELPWDPGFSANNFPLELLRPEVAFIAEGTYWATWLATAAAGLGKTAAYDFGLACCDESSEIRRYWPGLSRVTFDHYGMGQQAAAMMLQRLDEKPVLPDSILLESGWRAGNTAWGPDAARL